MKNLADLADLAVLADYCPTTVWPKKKNFLKHGIFSNAATAATEHRIAKIKTFLNMCFIC